MKRWEQKLEKLKRMSLEEIFDNIREEASGACDPNCQGRCYFGCPTDNIENLLNELKRRIP